MKYTKDFEKLGLPKDFKFGIELEAFNVKTKGKNSLYKMCNDKNNPIRKGTINKNFKGINIISAENNLDKLL